MCEVYIDDDVEPSVTREILGYLGIFRNLGGYLEGFLGKKTGNFRIDF